MTDSVVNLKAVKDNIKREAKSALEATLQDTLDIAKDLAPVRDIFVGGEGTGRRGSLSPSQVDDPSDRSSRGKVGNPALLAERGKKVIRKSLSAQTEFLKMVNSQQSRRHQFSIVTTDPHKGGITGKKRVRTRHTDQNPVLKDVRGTPRQGEFRDVTDYYIQEGRVVLPPRELRGPPAARGKRGGKQGPAAVTAGNIDQFLSAKGKAELKRQVAIESKSPKDRYSSLANAAFFESSSGAVEFGGRLRDEIFATEVVDDGNTMFGHVVSPTEYAKYQEYGTSRHRAQPYMRPALYKARGILLRRLQQRLGREFR